MLTKQNLTLAKLASKGTSRFAINGIYVTPAETVATDGLQLTRLTVKAEPLPPVAEPGLAKGAVPVDDWTPFVMPAAAALDAAKKMAKTGAFVAAETADNGHSALIVGNEVLRAQKSDAKYPDYQRCIPKIDAPAFEIIVNPELLAKVLEFHASTGAKSVRLVFQEAESPFLVKSATDGQVCESVVMPMRA